MWAWWALGVGLAVAGLAYRRMILDALIYGDLVRSAFDLYRFALDEALHLPRPPAPAAEREAGEQITLLLWRGRSPRDTLTPAEHPLRQQIAN